MAIRTEQEADISVITIDDPATRNSLAPQDYTDIRIALERAAQTSRCAILTGAGPAFSAGANLGGGGKLNPLDPEFDAGAVLEANVNPLMERMRDLLIPVVAAVHGAAAGVGCSIALACDLIVASEDAYFLQAFCRIGLVPDGGSPYLLAAAAGRARAMEMMLLGERIPAHQALEWGLINRVVPANSLMPAAHELAARLAAGPTAALGRIRRLAWGALEQGWTAQLAAEREVQREAGRQAEFREGVSAFLGKRAADFRGAGQG